MWIEWRRMERTGLRLAQESVRPLYERTRRFRVYSPGLVPGILQTEAYTRAILQGFMRRRRLPDDIDAAVAVRMERQRFLHKGNHRFAVLMEQSALWSGVGGTDVTPFTAREHAASSHRRFPVSTRSILQSRANP